MLFSFSLFGEEKKQKQKILYPKEHRIKIDRQNAKQALQYSASNLYTYA
tara:strand:+ start:495 stop:641 length:147 start_codon:yes stop_codon:yes gene_type:complete